ncbi:uncharacterized protein [Diabrotica undecimpunctata]|uniref:uncharacterized protein n=1 Tax=Diabrotica undecimpunctata TaxID=50387 RepID=UPI003B631EEF
MSLQNKYCKKCKKTVVNGVKCINCDASIHVSCARKSNNVKFINDELIECCLPVKPEDQIFLEAMDNLITDDKVIDINIFKYIIRQKDTLIKELYGKIDLMSQHIDLLKQLNSQKNVVENQEQLIHQNKVINKDTLMDSVETKSVRQPINANKDRTVASSSQKCEVTKKDVSEAILQVTTEQKLNEYIYVGESNQEKSEWTEVDRRKKRKHLVVGKNTEMILNGKEIKGVHKLIDLHVYRVDPDMTAENMRELMKTTFPEVKVESLKSKHPDIYSSFKVTIFNNNFKEAMSPKIWPCGAHVQRFFHVTPRKPQEM